MRMQTFCTSTCRCCHHYKPEGRRGGTCQQLGVPVRGCWKACSLGVPAFERYRSDLAILEHSLMLDYLPSYPAIEGSGVETGSPSQGKEATAA